MARSTRKRLGASLVLGLVVGALLLTAYRLEFFRTAQLQGTDFLFKARTATTARSTTIVSVDERSYRALLPRYGPLRDWPRSLYARALDSLREAGPRVVVFDILFDAPRSGDAELAAAIRRSGNVLLPVQAEGPRDIAPALGVVQQFDALVRSTASVREAAGEGLTNLKTDPDTTVRSLPLLLRVGEADVPALPLVAVARYIRRPRVIDAPPTEDRVFAAARAIPTVEGGYLLVNYLGPPSSVEQSGPFRIIPFVDVLDGTFDHALVADRIVLVGAMLRGIDEHATPSSTVTRMSGVEVLANAIETLLSQRYLVTASEAQTTGLIVGFALAAALLAALARPIFAALGTLGLLGLYVLATAVVVDRGVLLNPVYPPAALLLGFAAALGYRAIYEQAQQQAVREVMGRYLSPSVSRWVLEDPDRLRLGGETREMTVLFSDLRGFTSLAHALDPAILTSLLNEYMSAMTSVVFKHDGVLDKYIGDAIMAFWGAPVVQPDHARRACEAALEMVATLHELRSGWERRGLPLLDLGIGINTGPMVVGNMGSRRRLAYTVLGDAVNVASRLEGLNKEYGTRIVVGQATHEAVGEAFVQRGLDVVAVKGRDEPLAVYELVGRAGRVAPPLQAMLTAFDRARELYRARCWAAACAGFRDILASAPDDGPSALYLSRCEELLEHPPAPEWDGVFVARTK